jgi:hypothetical protein
MRRHATVGVSVSEDAGQQNGGQLPRFPDREDGQERAERSERHGRKLAWPDTISPICEAAVELLGFLQHL